MKPHLSLVVLLASFASTHASIVAQEWSTVAEPFNRNLILKCDLYRTDYEYRFTNLFFFRRTNQLVSSVKLAPDGMYEEKIPVFHGKDTSLFGFTGYIDRLEIYDYYIFGTCEEVDIQVARETINEYNAGLEEQRKQSASYRLF